MSDTAQCPGDFVTVQERIGTQQTGPMYRVTCRACKGSARSISPVWASIRAHGGTIGGAKHD